MIPYHDENQTRRTAVLTIGLVAANVLVWLLVQGAGSAYPLAWSVCELGLIPGEITGRAAPGSAFPIGHGLVCATDPGWPWQNVFTSMFLHGSWMHLLGNMWFLWLFGNNIEDSMGRDRFLFFYLLCGIGAAALQVAVHPDSIIPMVGASGAISGVMGAYLVLFPRVKVYAWVPLGFIPLSIALPAWTMLLYWMGLQLVGGLLSPMDGGGVAFWAHVGGFLAGVVLVKLFAREDYLIEHQRVHWQPRHGRRHEGW